MCVCLYVLDWIVARSFLALLLLMFFSRVPGDSFAECGGQACVVSVWHSRPAVRHNGVYVLQVCQVCIGARVAVGGVIAFFSSTLTHRDTGTQGHTHTHTYHLLLLLLANVQLLQPVLRVAAV